MTHWKVEDTGITARIGGRDHCEGLHGMKKTAGAAKRKAAKRKKGKGKMFIIDTIDMKHASHQRFSIGPQNQRVHRCLHQFVGLGVRPGLIAHTGSAGNIMANTKERRKQGNHLLHL